MTHRDKRLDKYIGSRMKVTFFDDLQITGRLDFDESRGCYVLKNVIDKNGMPGYDTVFRKSHVKAINVFIGGHHGK